MVRHIIMSVAVVTMCMICVECGFPDLREGHPFSPAITDFSLNLFNILNENKTDENLLISPTSIFRAMLLTYFGSEGLTSLLMEMAMKLDLNYTEAVNQYKIWRNETVDGVQEGDKIYVDSKIQLKPNITALLGKDISQIDFCKSYSVGVINDWVANVTRGEIKDFIDEIRQDTLMMLISVIYMKKAWKSSFNKKYTRGHFFFLENGSSIYTQMMYKKEMLFYQNSSALKSEILSIPYKGYRYQFIVLLPYKGSMTVGSLINSLNYTILWEEIRNMARETIHLYLPKFKVEAEVDMKPLLESLGLSTLFSPRTANFSGFTDHELYVSDVVQKAVIKVNEKGTTAAAATYLRMAARSLWFDRELYFWANRPFVYMVYDGEAQMPLFLGKMMRPEYPAEVEVTHKFGPSITDFSLDLFRVLQKNSTGDNLVMSPSNIFRVMLLTYFGSAGLTSLVMESVMGINMSFTETVAQYQLWKQQTLEGVKEADRIYFETSLNISDQITKLIGGDISQLDFDNPTSIEVINNWVEDKTGGEIKDFIDELDSDMKMLLISAIYMQKPWESGFSTESTRAMNFTLSNGTTKEVQTMVKTDESFRYLESDTLRSTVLTIPYEDERLSFIIFLPDESNSTTIEDVLTCMNSTNLKQELKFRRKVEVNFYLPKFEVHNDLDFSLLLGKIGLQELFYSGIANFTNFASDPTLHVSKVFQKVVIKVDEEGTTASAASAVILASYGGSRPEDLILDRPFIYMVYDELAEVPLFLGTLMDPTVKN